MFNNPEKDERVEAVEKQSYCLGYKILSFAVLLDVIYRSIVLKTAAWDLLGIVILGGLAATAYQTRYKIATRSWVKAILLTILAAVLIAAVLVLLGC
jgi:hypothetical protein